MSVEMPIEAPNILEKLRGLVGGLLRPDRLFFKNCVQPVIDVSNYGQATKVLSGTFTISGAQGYGTALSLFAGFVPGKQYRVLNITGVPSSLGGGLTVVGVGYNKNGSNFVVGAVNTTKAATATADMYGGDLDNPVILSGSDQFIVNVSAYTSGSPTIVVNALVVELDAN